jgi:hypothetical protein
MTDHSIPEKCLDLFEKKAFAHPLAGVREGGRNHARGRRRAYRQDGQKIQIDGRIPELDTGHGAGALQDQA